MDKNYLQNLYNKLPPDLQDAMFSIDSTESIRDIGNQHELLIDKMGVLGQEVGLLMLGYTKPTEFVGRLQNGLGVDRIKANAIARDVNEKIFLKIRESLKKIHQGEELSIEDDVHLESGGLNREEVLRGIEEPHTITEAPAGVGKVGQGTEAKNPSAPENLPTGTPSVVFLEKHPEEAVNETKQALLVESIGVNLLADKLQKVVRTPPEKTFIQELPKVSAPTSYKIDPYREPTN
jgi:hypothetical protein